MSDYIPRAFTQAYGSAVGAILHAPYIYDTDYALAQDDQSYMLMRRDAVVAHAIEYRKALAAGLDWHLDPASPAPHDVKVAALLEALVKKIPRFAEVRKNMQEAVIQGESWQGLEGSWTNCAIAGGPVRRWWTITGIVDLDKRRFRQEKRTGTPENTPAWDWTVQRFFPLRWEKCEETHYIHHVAGSGESTLGRGFGLGSLIWHYWRDKVQLLKLWLQRLDRWALGNLVAKVALDEQSRRDPNNSQRVQSWLTVLNKMRAGHVCVFDAKDAIELVEATGDGSEIRQAVNYFDEAIIRLALGSVMPTGGNNVNGSYGRAEIESDSTNLIIRGDHLNIEETITDSPVTLLYRANYRNILAETAGVHPSGPSEFRLKSDRKGDPFVNAQVLEKVLPIAPVRADEFYSKLGLTPPAAGEATIGGPGSPLALAASGPLSSDPGALPANPVAAQLVARARAASGMQAPSSSSAGSMPTGAALAKNRIAALLAQARSNAGAA